MCTLKGKNEMYGSVLRSKLSQNNVLQLGTEESFVKKKRKEKKRFQYGSVVSKR